MAKQRTNDFFHKDDGLWDDIGVWVDRRDPQIVKKISNFYYWVEEKGRDIYCLFKGHDYQPEQCGIPEHDYCTWCFGARPNNVPRPI